MKSRPSQDGGAETKCTISPDTFSLLLIFPSTSIFSSPRRDTLCQRFISFRWILINQKYVDCGQSRQSTEVSAGYCYTTNISLIWWRICKLMKWGELCVNGNFFFPQLQSSQVTLSLRCDSQSSDKDLVAFWKPTLSLKSFRFASNEAAKTARSVSEV